MTLDKLHKNYVNGIGTTIWPLYMVFKHRLVTKKFDDIKIVHTAHADFKRTIREDIEQNGLLCPLVIDKDNRLRNGNHRFKAIRKFGDGSLFYQANSREEVNFFSRLNVLCWELHPDMTQLMEKLWQGKYKKYTEKVPHIFKENVKTAKL